MVFWSDHEIKMPRKGVFSLNREIKMLHKSKIVQKIAKIYIYIYIYIIYTERGRETDRISLSARTLLINSNQL